MLILGELRAFFSFCDFGGIVLIILQVLGYFCLLEFLGYFWSFVLFSRIFGHLRGFRIIWSFKWFRCIFCCFEVLGHFVHFNGFGWEAGVILVILVISGVFLLLYWFQDYFLHFKGFRGDED